MRSILTGNKGLNVISFQCFSCCCYYGCMFYFLNVFHCSSASPDIDCGALRFLLLPANQTLFYVASILCAQVKLFPSFRNLPATIVYRNCVLINFKFYYLISLYLVNYRARVFFFHLYFQQTKENC